jgi:hypothetical protein
LKPEGKPELTLGEGGKLELELEVNGEGEELLMSSSRNDEMELIIMGV